MARFDLDAIKAKYDMRQIFPATPARKDYDGYSLDKCIFHDDAHASMLIGKEWFKCRAACPQGFGDVISWTMRSANLSFVEACKQLDEGTAPLAISGINYSERPHAPPPEFKPDLPTEYVLGMADADYEHFTRTTGISRACAVEHKVGRYDEGIYTIPVHDPAGKLIDIKLYRPEVKPGQLKTWHLEKGAPNALYGVPYLNGDKFAVIVGGEKDTMNGHDMHLPFVTDTSGEGSWSDEFNKFLNERDEVYAFLDADPTGEWGNKRVLKKFRRAIWCDWHIHWSPDVKKGYDFSDFKAEGGTREMFLQMLENAKLGLLKPLKPTLKPGALRRHYDPDEGEL